MKTLECLLESWAELVEQCHLAREDRVAATVGRLDHPQHRICRRVGFERMVGVVFSRPVTKGTDVAVDVKSSGFVHWRV
jgi:hypothetical protein